MSSNWLIRGMCRRRVKPSKIPISPHAGCLKNIVAHQSGSIINYCGCLPESSIKLCLNERLCEKPSLASLISLWWEENWHYDPNIELGSKYLTAIPSTTRLIQCRGLIKEGVSELKWTRPCKLYFPDSTFRKTHNHFLSKKNPPKQLNK